MSGAARDPDAVLEELGAALEGAWARESAGAGGAAAAPRRLGRRVVRSVRLRRRPRLRGGRRGLIAAAAAGLALVPTAIATREAVWAPDPPPALPAALRSGAPVVPGAAGTPVYVGAGELRGVGWRLSATTCRYGRIQAVGLFLSVPGGGAGARCDVATGGGGTTSPRALAARRVQTYYDPASNVTWAFGALPAGARTVAVTSRAYGGGPATTHRLAAVAVDGDAITQGHLPDGLRVFVAALPGGRDVARVRADDGAGHLLLTCDHGRCDR